MSEAAPTVLVVDDDPSARGIVSGALGTLGYECVCAGDGAQALDVYSKGLFDLVITDLDMPRMGGLELVRRLRSEREEVPVIIMTAFADFASAREAIRLEVADYLVKPFDDLKELQAAARRAVQTKTKRAGPEDLLLEMENRWSTGRLQKEFPGPALKKPSDELVKGFRVLDVLGVGAMGTVYRAIQVSLDRTVALKVLRNDLSADSEYVKRFLREARVVARLDHVNLVRGITAGRDGSTFYLAMEFVDGETLDDILRRETVLAEAEAVEMAAQVAAALEHAWEIGLVHRDVKPANIIIAKSGTVKLADLGLARGTAPESTTFTSPGIALGTPAYMSPEQALALPTVDVRADIYSLGACMYHMVVGKMPFESPDVMVLLRMQAEQDIVPVHKRNRNVSRELSGMISKMMEKDPELRYQTPTELREDLELIADGKEPRHIMDATKE